MYLKLARLSRIATSKTRYLFSEPHYLIEYASSIPTSVVFALIDDASISFSKVFSRCLLSYPLLFCARDGIRLWHLESTFRIVTHIGRTLRAFVSFADTPSYVLEKAGSKGLIIFIQQSYLKPRGKCNLIDPTIIFVRWVHQISSIYTEVFLMPK